MSAGGLTKPRKAATKFGDSSPDGKGNYFIQSKISELFLDPNPAADDMEQTNQGPDVVWQLVPDGNGNYYIKSPASGKNLDDANANTSVGGKIHMAPQDGKQTWKLIQYNEGFVSYLFVTSYKCSLPVTFRLH